MATINFDYAKLTAHPRFRALSRILGGTGNGLDCVCRFWNIAQDYWGKGRRPVPLKVFDLDDDFKALIDCDFAELTTDGVLANGAWSFFDWFAERREAAHKGGLASVEARRAKFGTAIPRGARNSEARPNASSVDSPNQKAFALDATEASPNPSITSSINSKKTSSSSPEDHALAEEWFEFAKAHSTTVKLTPKWADAVRQLREIDKLPLEEIRKLLAFVKTDAFWLKNALSLPSIRQRSRNGLLKFENIRAAMQQRPLGLQGAATPKPTVPLRLEDLKRNK